MSSTKYILFILAIQLHNNSVFGGLKTQTGFKVQVFSPIRTVIVSPGNVRYFYHLQGVVGDIIAVQIQNIAGRPVVQWITCLTMDQKILDSSPGWLALQFGAVVA